MKIYTVVIILLVLVISGCEQSYVEREDRCDIYYMTILNDSIIDNPDKLNYLGLENMEFQEDLQKIVIKSKSQIENISIKSKNPDIIDIYFEVGLKKERKKELVETLKKELESKWKIEISPGWSYCFKTPV